MNISTEIWQGFVVCLSAVFTQNILLSYFLGLCPFLGVSREVKAALGLGTAVTFVLTCTCALNWLLYKFVLVPLHLEFFRFILFIIVIAAFVQFVEMVIERYSPVLYQKLGVFLPLITVNCAILGTSLFMVNGGFRPVAALVYGFGSGAGWLIAIVLLAGIRGRLRNAKIPPALDGPGITLVITGIMALAFIVFQGMIKR